MSDSLATPQDLSDALNRPLTTDEAARAQRRLDTAQSLLAARVPNLVDRVQGTTTPLIDPAAAAEVIATIVARQWRNPDGALNRSTTIGPYSESVGYGERVGGEQVGRGELVVTDADVAKLTATPAFSRGGTIRTAPTEYPFADPFPVWW